MHQLENIFLMRHGLSVTNVDLSLYKQIPDHAVPLSEKGKEQSEEAGKHFAAFLDQSPHLKGERIYQFFGTLIRDAEKPPNLCQMCFSFCMGIHSGHS